MKFLAFLLLVVVFSFIVKIWEVMTDKPVRHTLHGKGRIAETDDINHFDEEDGLPAGWYEVPGKKKPSLVELFHKQEKKPHGVIIGGTGGLKSMGILVPIALSNAVDGRSLIFIDVTGDLTSVIMPHRAQLGDAYVLDSFGMSKNIDIGSAKRVGYNVMAQLAEGDPSLLSGKSGTLASTLIASDDDRNRYWYSQTRRALKAVISHQATDSPERQNLSAVADIVFGNFTGWARNLWTSDQVAPEIKQALFSFAEGGDVKSIPEVLETIRSELSWLLDPVLAASVREGPRFKQCSQKVTTYSIMLPMNRINHETIHWLSSVLAGSLMELQDDDRGDVETVVMCDEFYQYHKGIDDIVARIYASGRKWGLSIYTCATSLNQFERCFGDGQAHDVLNNTGALHILNSADVRTSGFVKDSAGQQTVTSMSSTKGSNPDGKNTSSLQTSLIGVPVIRPEDLRGFKNKQVLWLEGCEYPILSTVRGYFDVEKYAKRAGRNIFYKPRTKSAKA